MNKLFEEQLATNKVVTEETLERLQNKSYTNGDPIKIGDQVLYAYREGEPYEDVEHQQGKLIPIELITLNESQITQYDFVPESVNLQIPVLKNKK